MAITAGSVASAADVNALLAATTPTTFTTSPAGSGWYMTIGSFAVVWFATTANVTAGTQVTVYTLPAGMRPGNAIPLAASSATTLSRPAGGAINTDGTIVIRNNFTSDSIVSGYAVYPLP